MADIIFDPAGSIESFTNNINIISSKNESVMILACDANGFKKELIDPILLKHTTSIIGGVFPSIIYNAKKYDQGTIFIGLDDKDLSPTRVVSNDWPESKPARRRILVPEFPKSRSISGEVKPSKPTPFTMILVELVFSILTPSFFNALSVERQSSEFK